METKKFRPGYREGLALRKYRMDVVYKAATEVLDEELRQDLRLWAEAVLRFLHSGKLTSM